MAGRIRILCVLCIALAMGPSTTFSADEKISRRRWCQFSLAKLFVLTTAVGGYFGWRQNEVEHEASIARGKRFFSEVVPEPLSERDKEDIARFLVDSQGPDDLFEAFSELAGWYPELGIAGAFPLGDKNEFRVFLGASDPVSAWPELPSDTYRPLWRYRRENAVGVLTSYFKILEKELEDRRKMVSGAATVPPGPGFYFSALQEPRTSWTRQERLSGRLKGWVADVGPHGQIRGHAVLREIEKLPGAEAALVDFMKQRRLDLSVPQPPLANLYYMENGNPVIAQDLLGYRDEQHLGLKLGRGSELHYFELISLLEYEMFQFVSKKYGKGIYQVPGGATISQSQSDRLTARAREYAKEFAEHIVGGKWKEAQKK